MPMRLSRLRPGLETSCGLGHGLVQLFPSFFQAWFCFLPCFRARLFQLVEPLLRRLETRTQRLRLLTDCCLESLKQVRDLGPQFVDLSFDFALRFSVAHHCKHTTQFVSSISSRAAILSRNILRKTHEQWNWAGYSKNLSTGPSDFGGR